MLNNSVIKLAEDFCLKHDIRQNPVNIIGICNSLGIKVFEEYLPVEVSGFIMTRKDKFEKYDSNKVIVVNLSDSPKRRRFTITHELAHYVLHRKSSEDLYAHRDAGQVSEMEMQANIFASNVLMPESLVHEQLKNVKTAFTGYMAQYAKVKHIAEEFAVSESAAEVRLKQLGII